MKKVTLMLAALMLTVLFSSCAGKKPAKEWTVGDLAGKTVGVQIGSPGALLAMELAEELENMQVKMYRSAATAAVALSDGVIDAIIVDSVRTRDIINATDGIELAGSGIFEPERYAVAVKKGNKKLLGLINVIIDEIKTDGELERLVDGFISTPEDGRGDYITPEQTGDDGTLKMAISTGFKPFEYFEGSAAAGFNVELAKLVAKRANKTLVFKKVESDALLTALRNRQVDFAFVRMSLWGDKLESFDLSNIYYTSNQALIIRSQ